MHAHVDAGPAEYELGAVAGGEPPGEWLILGENPLNLHGKITAEGPSGDKFRKLVNHLQNPDTGEQLGRAPITNSGDVNDKIEDRVKRWRRRHKYATAEDEAAYRIKTAADTRTGVTGWDAAFSAPKSWSVLWAAYTWAGRHDEAAKLWQALEAGVRAAVAQLFEELSFTRHGTAGPKVNDTVTTDYRRAANLMTAMFRHHVSRERDPQMHIHVMVLNRLLTESGAWHALYSGALLRSKPQLDATFQRVAESEARRLLGLSFVRNPETPWREIEGVAPDVRDYFSSRSRALSERAEERARAFEKMYGKRPNARQLWQMRQRATLETRRAKAKNPPPAEEEVERWAEETHRAAVAHFEDVLATVDAVVELAEDDEAPRYDPDEVVRLAVADVEAESSVFNYARLSHAVSQRLPDRLDVESHAIRALVTRLTDQAIAQGKVVPTNGEPVVEVPRSMRDPLTGRSRFDAPDSRKFTTAATLGAEDALVARLDVRGARPVPAGTARALLAETKLFPEQASAARGVLSSPWSVEFIVAAAGTGKSVTVKAISDVAEQVWGTGVTAFTLSESAAMVLRREGLARAHNIERFLNYTERAERGAVSESDRVQFAVPAGGVVVLDEANMIDTSLMTRLLAKLDEAGVGKVVLVGDPAQADAVGQGGAFSMLVREAEKREKQTRGLPCADDFAAAEVAAWTGGREREPVRVHRLSQVRRFTQRWEREASKALRDGKVEALAQYQARGRVRGDQNRDRVRDLVVRGFVTDWLSGRDSIMVAGTAEEADDLSSRARQRLVEAGHVAEHGGVRVRGHNLASVGDVVQSRLNDHPAGVLNRDRWQVVGTSENGELHVRQILGPDEYAEQVRVLEPGYVRRQVELGYAGTVHAVEGVTVRGTGHSLVGRLAGASHAYVAATRATESNSFYVELEEGEAPVGRLAAIFGSDDHAKAARVEIEDDQLRQRSLGHLFVLWETAVRETRAADHRSMLLAELGDDAELVLSDPAVHRLFGLLRQAEVTGHDPRALVASVMGRRREHNNPLSAVESPASLLFARVSDEMTVAGLGAPVAVSFESRVPPAAAGEVENENRDFARRLGRILDRRTSELALQAAEEASPWAVRVAGPVPVDDAERFAWIGRVSHAAALREVQGYTSDRDAIGARPSHVEPERVWLWDLAARDIGMPEHERDLVGRGDDELRNRVARYEQVLAWLPRNVDADLRETYLARQEAERQVVEARVAGRDPSTAEADREAMDGFIVALERVAEIRAQAVERTGPQRLLAEEADRELERRAELARARDGVPLPAEPGDPELDDPGLDDPDAEVDDPDPEVARQAGEDADIGARAAVFGLWSQHRVPGAPVFGSPEWVALPEGDAAKRAAVVAAAVSWWNVGEPRDAEARVLADRLEAAAEVIGVAAHREVDPEVLEGVFGWQAPHMTGEAPIFGSPEWAELDEADPRREAAVVRAATAWWRVGEPVEELERRTVAAEDRATSIDIAQGMQRARYEQHRERVERERMERIVEEQRARDIARRHTPTREERALDRRIEAEAARPEPQPAIAEEPVVWPEPAPIPEPEPEPEPDATPTLASDPEPEPEVQVSELISEPEPEPFTDEPLELNEPETDPVVEDRFQAGLEWSLEQARLQQETDEREAAEAADDPDTEPLPEPESEPGPEVGPVDERAEKAERFQRDLEQAERAAQIMAERREAEETAAALPEPEIEVEPEAVDV